MVGSDGAPMQHLFVGGRIKYNANLKCMNQYSLLEIFSPITESSLKIHKISDVQDSPTSWMEIMSSLKEDCGFRYSKNKKSSLMNKKNQTFSKPSYCNKNIAVNGVQSECSSQCIK